MAEQFDPYHVWLGIPPDQQPPTHYRLLGIELFESNSDVIDAAASRQTVYLHQLAAGPERKSAQAILNEIAAARRCLLTAKSKAAYDQKLKAAQKSGKTRPAGKPKGPGSTPRLKADSPPTIQIDTTASPSRPVRQKKQVPWWAQPVTITGAGTVLLLILALIGRWLTTPDPPPESELKPNTNQRDVSDEPASAAPDSEEAQDFFVVDDTKATKKGKWTTPPALSGFVGESFVTSNDKKASIRFEFSPPASAPYEIRLKYRTDKLYGDAVPIKVQVRNVAENTTLNMKQAPLGRERHKFLGVKFLKAKQPIFVELKVAGAGGRVYADAVEFIRRSAVDIGLRAWWPMEQVGTQQLAEIGGISAELKGGQSVPGVSGKAVSFAPGDTMKVPPQLVSAAQGSVSLWVRQDAPRPVVFLKTEEGQGGQPTMRISTVADGKEFRLVTRISATPQSPGISVDQKIVPKTWYHLALTWNQSGASQVFCNGKRIGQQQKTPRLPKSLGVLIGAATESSGPVSIDEIRFYQQRILTAADVRSLIEPPDSP